MKRGRLVAVLGLVVLLGACDWLGFHNGPDHTGYQPYETTIGVANVAKLTQARIYPTTGSILDPVVANGVLYVVGSNTLYAFDATGATHCQSVPTSCTPLWTTGPGTDPATGLTVSNGSVFVTLGQYGVAAYDAAGSTNCHGTPKVCGPLWTTPSLSPALPFRAGGGYPVVVNGVLYVAGAGQHSATALTAGGAYVAAFDAAGSNNCTVALPKVCTPIWTTTADTDVGADGSPTIANGILYIAANGNLLAFDAHGSMNCTGTVKACAPLWTAPLTPAQKYLTPAVANGYVYLNTYSGTMDVFDAAGSKNCNAMKVCTPLWTAPTNHRTSSTTGVAQGIAYVVTENGMLYAFDATGSTCAGTPRVCTALWTTQAGPTGYSTFSSPAIANGVVYFVSTDGAAYAYDASGTTNCSPVLKTCAKLWSGSSGFAAGASPAIANGVLYIAVNGNGVYAYSP